MNLPQIISLSRQGVTIRFKDTYYSIGNFHVEINYRCVLFTAVIILLSLVWWRRSRKK